MFVKDNSYTFMVTVECQRSLKLFLYNKLILKLLKIML